MDEMQLRDKFPENEDYCMYIWDKLTKNLNSRGSNLKTREVSEMAQKYVDALEEKGVDPFEKVVIDEDLLDEVIDEYYDNLEEKDEEQDDEYVEAMADLNEKEERNAARFGGHNNDSYDDIASDDIDPTLHM